MCAGLTVHARQYMPVGECVLMQTCLCLHVCGSLVCKHVRKACLDMFNNTGTCVHAHLCVHVCTRRSEQGCRHMPVSASVSVHAELCMYVRMHVSACVPVHT